MNLKKRIPIYFLGVLVMMFGVVMISQADIGISPASAIPFALSKLTGMTFGTWTTLYHIFCVLLQIIMLKKLTVKMLLQLGLAYVTGKVIDLYNLLYKLLPFVVKESVYPVRLAFCLVGIAVTALGIVMIVGMDLMLPPPDAFMRSISANFGTRLDRTKICVDCASVLVAFLLCVIFALVTTGGVSWSNIYAIREGTILSAILNGTCVGIYRKHLKGLTMAPLPDKTLIGKK